MRIRKMPTLAVLAVSAVALLALASEAPAPSSPPARVAAATQAAQTASAASAASTGTAPSTVPSAHQPAAPGKGAEPIEASAMPAAGTEAANRKEGQSATADTIAHTTAQEEGAAVVQQILKDKEDLIEGKRFTYDPGGRRDPFRSLLEVVRHFSGPRPKGVGGMLIAEIILQGTVKDRTGNVAFLRGSDNKGYFVHVGDEVYDGRIISIDPDSGTVTFRQRVDDPRQIKPYRDLVKRLRNSTEEEAQ